MPPFIFAASRESSAIAAYKSLRSLVATERERERKASEGKSERELERERSIEEERNRVREREEERETWDHERCVPSESSPGGGTGGGRETR